MGCFCVFGVSYESLENTARAVIKRKQLIARLKEIVLYTNDAEFEAAVVQKQVELFNKTKRSLKPISQEYDSIQAAHDFLKIASKSTKFKNLTVMAWVESEVKQEGKTTYEWGKYYEPRHRKVA
ncbi:MAG: hypothetical protein K2Y28_07730 [Burkholderiaceae bacterium]|nr:hypothetical protein [Burkholderiaceae bacterium]